MTVNWKIELNGSKNLVENKVKLAAGCGLEVKPTPALCQEKIQELGLHLCEGGITGQEATVLWQLPSPHECRPADVQCKATELLWALWDLDSVRVTMIFLFSCQSLLTSLSKFRAFLIDVQKYIKFDTCGYTASSVPSQCVCAGIDPVLCGRSVLSFLKLLSDFWVWLSATWDFLYGLWHFSF